jgi:membrane associated rhomboid family serine protease
MAWRDRDYSKDEPWTQHGSVRSRLRWPGGVAGILVLLHVAAFILVLFLRTEAGGAALANSLALSEKAAHPWAIFTHPLATPSLLSLIITVFILWTLAARIERQFGWRRMIALYASGNVLAGAAFFALARMSPPLASAGLDSPTGAFAAWFVMAYRGMGNQMMPLFGRMYRLSRVVAVALAVMTVLMLALRGVGAIGWLAALAAGACAEPLLANLSGALAGIPHRRRRRVVRPSIPRFNGARGEREPEQYDVDDILAKISRDGMESLTPADRERLEAARQAKLHESDWV